MGIVDTFVKGVILLVGIGCMLGGGFCVIFPLTQAHFGGLDMIALFSGIGALFVIGGFFIVRAIRRWGVRTPGQVMDFEKPHMRDTPHD